MEEAPKYVDVSYKINCVSHIDSVTSTYYVDVKLFYHWIDPNFIGRKKNETVDVKTEGSWNPDIIVTNEHELVSVEEHKEVKVNNPTTGEIKASTQYRGTLFINNMDLATFPVDCQNLQICLKPYKLETEKVLLRPRREESAIEHQDSHEWMVLGHFMKAFETDREASSTKKAYSTMYITVLVQRQSGWFVSNVFLLIWLLLLYDWFSFLLPPPDTQGKLDLTNTALLASIAHKFVVGDELPKVPYRTLLDVYVDGCFFLQFLVVMSLFVVEYMERYRIYMHDEAAAEETVAEEHRRLDPETEEFPWKLNWILLAVNVFLYLLLVAWVLLKVHFVKTDVEHWLRIADHINSGQSDAVSVSVKEIHHITQPPKHWTLDFLHSKRNNKSKFLHFGGHKKAAMAEPGTLSAKVPSAGASMKGSAKVYAYGEAGAEA